MEESEQKVPDIPGRAAAIGRELRLIRKILELNQPKFAERLGVNENTYPSYENGNRTPDVQLLDKAKSLYKAQTGHDWSPPVSLRDLVQKEPEVYQAGAAPQGQEPYARPGYMPPVAGWAAPPQGPTERDRWVATQILENALRKEGLFDLVPEDLQAHFSGDLARSLAGAETLESLQLGLKTVVGLIGKAYRKENE